VEYNKVLLFKPMFYIGLRSLSHISCIYYKCNNITP